MADCERCRTALQGIAGWLVHRGASWTSECALHFPNAREGGNGLFPKSTVDQVETSKSGGIRYLMVSPPQLLRWRLFNGQSESTSEW